MSSSTFANMMLFTFLAMSNVSLLIQLTSRGSEFVRAYFVQKVVRVKLWTEIEKNFKWNHFIILYKFSSDCFESCETKNIENFCSERNFQAISIFSQFSYIQGKFCVDCERDELKFNVELLLYAEFFYNSRLELLSRNDFN